MMRRARSLYGNGDPLRRGFPWKGIPLYSCLSFRPDSNPDAKYEFYQSPSQESGLQGPKPGQHDQQPSPLHDPENRNSKLSRESPSARPPPPPLTAAETPICTNLGGSPPREALRPSPARGQPRRRPRRWSPPRDSSASRCVPTPAELGRRRRRRLKGASSAATRPRLGSPSASALPGRGEVPVI